MIVGFVEERIVIRGKSKGLSAASYDMTLAEDITLGVLPGYIIRDHLRLHGLNPFKLRLLVKALLDNPPIASIAHTEEDLRLPADISGCVMDKSTYARLFVSHFNTYIDPGFDGNLTLELVNLSEYPRELRAGDPICQIVFNFLDKPTDRPYGGKYQGQTRQAHGARHERPGGGYIEGEALDDAQIAEVERWDRTPESPKVPRIEDVPCLWAESIPSGLDVSQEQIKP